MENYWQSASQLPQILASEDWNAIPSKMIDEQPQKRIPNLIACM